MTVHLPPAGPLDPFAPSPGGVYRDEMVEVCRSGAGRGRRERGMVRTAHFDLLSGPERVRVAHTLSIDEVDDDLAGLLADELFRPGWLRGSEMFERLFTGVVRTVADDPVSAWGAFYRNTMATAAAPPAADPDAGVPSPAHGTIAGYAPVWAHATGLVGSGPVLELGSCFGFFALSLASTGRDVTASDVSAGTISLLATMAPTLGVDLGTLVADAAHLPVADSAFDTVLALHLLEHLDPDHGDRVIAEALRAARTRLVVAVPLEEVADDTWGHVRTVSLDDLDAWGRTSRRSYDVHEHHGGWLVVDL